MNPVLTAALFLSLPFQDDVPVTLDLPISPLPVICKELEAQTGFQYQVNGANRNQQIFVRVSKMPSSRLRDAIAEVTKGRWTKAGSTWALQTFPDDSVQDEAFRKSVAAWFKKQPAVGPLDRRTIEEAIKKSIQMSKPGEENQTGFQDFYKMTSLTPKRRLMLRLAQGIGLNDLLTVGPDERRVYALNPTALQRRLPAGVTSVLAQYAAENRIFAEIASRVAPDDTGSEERAWNPLIDPYRSEASSTRENPVVLLFIARRTMGSLQTEVKLYNAKGYLIDQESDSIGGMLGEVMEAGAVEADPFPKELAGMDVPLILSEEEKLFTKDLQQLLSGMGAGAKSSGVSEVTKTRLTNMDRSDPLLYGPTQMLRQFADHKKKQVVAKVTDLAIFSIAFGMDVEKPATLTSAISLALGAFSSFGSKDHGIKETEDLITLSPVSSEMMPFSMSMDRQACARYFRAIIGGGEVFEASADLAASCRTGMDMQLPSMLGMMLGGEAQMFFDDSSFDLLKLYGLLNSQQRLMVKQGGLSLPLNGIFGPIAAHARQMLLNGEDSYMGDDMAAPEAPEGPVAQVEAPAMTQLDEGMGRYDDEITVKLARMPMHLGVLQIAMDSKDALFIKSGMQMMSTTTEANPNTVAYMLVNSEQNPGQDYTKIAGFMYGKQRTLSAKFNFGKETLRASSLQTPLFAKSSKLLQLADLPAGFQAEVKKQMEDVRKEMLAMPRSGDGGGAIKPPQ